MRTPNRRLAWLAACSLLPLLPAPGIAQPNGLDPRRDCQVLTTCNYAPGGIYRGCLSSYSCRICRLVAIRCSPDTPGRECRQLVCTWG
jgi:hypothetical protein